MTEKARNNWTTYYTYNWMANIATYMTT